MAPPCGSGRRRSRAVKMTMCLYILIPMSSVGIRNNDNIFGKKEKLEVRQQLKRLNKPTLKTIKSPDGDIIDCIDINNQPAFDHPLLRNHTIQMRPSFYPKGFSFNESNKITQRWHLNGRCPEGTIPIRRTKEENLLRKSSAPNYGRKKHYTITNDEIDDGSNREYAAIIEQGKRYYGMNANINIWNPYTMDDDEFSLSQIWLATYDEDGQTLDTIEAGLMVFHRVFGDYHTRLFTYWTSDGYKNTGCYNEECEGFVQLDSGIALGTDFMPYSEYGGPQYSVNFFVWKDIVGGHWWLQLANKYILGYWPSDLFSLLSVNAQTVTWGGEVINRQIAGRHTTTQMGSGHFPEEGYSRASFFQNLRVVDTQRILRAPQDIQPIITKPKCYNLLENEDYFYLVVLVETLNVHEHLDYCFKIKEKKGKIKRGELFSSSLHVTPNLPTSYMCLENL